MIAIHRVLGYLQRVSRKLNKSHVAREPQLVASGWDKYAAEWNPAKLRVLPSHRPRYLGDEWTAEDTSAGGTTYGLTPDIIANFNDYINTHLLNPYLPSCAVEGLEIGPGGGRLTVLLVPRTKVLHLAEPSAAMLRHLKGRFVNVNAVRYYHTDGMTLPALRPGSLDYVIAFDVFVHFEARLVYWYLRQVAHLLKPGGAGIIHYANVLTPIGWQEFERRLESNIQKRDFATFGVTCPQLMARFLEALELEIISPDTGLIPRDAIAVFRKSMKDGR
jgi:SAM-dependent methyltransferase